MVSYLRKRVVKNYSKSTGIHHFHLLHSSVHAAYRPAASHHCVTLNKEIRDIPHFASFPFLCLDFLPPEQDLGSSLVIKNINCC